MMAKLLGYVEIKTKITSVFPYLMTLAYLVLNNKNIDPLRTSVFFAGMFLFDLTATTINNYNDTKKNHQTLQFSRRTALLITMILFAFSTALGIYLVSLTDVIVLMAGGLCFFFGVIYSYGPIPLSHGPYGEIASVFFYGALIPFILIYINDPTDLLTYSLSMENFALQINVVPVIGLVLMAILPFCLTANIMLANNICDVEHDCPGQSLYAGILFKEICPVSLCAFILCNIFVGDYHGCFPIFITAEPDIARDAYSRAEEHQCVFQKTGKRRDLYCFY